MGKIEYDVYADGKKTGTASRDQTDFEKALDDAAADLRHREARLNLIEESASRLARLYSSPSSASHGVGAVEIEIMDNRARFKKNIAIMLMYATLGIVGLILGVDLIFVLLFVAVMIARFVMAEIWQRVSYPIVYFVGGHVAIRVFENAEVGTVWFILGVCLLALDFLFLLIQSAIIFLNKDKLENELKEKKKIEEDAQKKKKEQINRHEYVVQPVDAKKIVEDLIDKGIF